jgi:hypothetical protein
MIARSLMPEGGENGAAGSGQAELLSHDRLAAIRARAEAATAGPWRADWKGTNHYEITSQASDNPYSFWVMTDSSARGEDLDFAAHARQDIPDLLAHAEALARRVADLEELARSLSERVHKQSELLSRRAEVQVP